MRVKLTLRSEVDGRLILRLSATPPRRRAHLLRSLAAAGLSQAGEGTDALLSRTTSASLAPDGDATPEGRAFFVSISESEYPALTQYLRTAPGSRALALLDLVTLVLAATPSASVPTDAIGSVESGHIWPQIQRHDPESNSPSATDTTAPLTRVVSGSTDDPRPPWERSAELAQRLLQGL
jgi:hypothetical protein